MALSKDMLRQPKHSPYVTLHQLTSRCMAGLSPSDDHRVTSILAPLHCLSVSSHCAASAYMLSYIGRESLTKS